MEIVGDRSTYMYRDGVSGLPSSSRIGFVMKTQNIFGKKMPISSN